MHVLQISAALEFPADLLSIVGLEWLGRRLRSFEQRNQAIMSQVVSRSLHVSRRDHHLALCLAHQPADATSNLCHGWKILCHLRHEHWLSVLSWGDLSKTNWRDFVFPGASHHPARAGHGSGPPDVHGQPSGVAPHCLLGELILTLPTYDHDFLRASCQRKLPGSSYHWSPSLPASQV